MRQRNQEDFTNLTYHPVLLPGEQLLWKGKPQRRAFVTVNCLKLLPLAVFWFYIDFAPVKSAIVSGEWFVIVFMTVHLSPVWIWLYSALTAGKRWNNTGYYLTNKRVVIRTGFWSVSEKSLYLQNITDVSVKSNILDRPFGTGSICFNVVRADYRRNGSLPPCFDNLEDPHNVYQRVQQAIGNQMHEQVGSYSFEAE